MNKRLVWNFEIAQNKSIQWPNPNDVKKETHRWEARFFWPANHIILLNGLDESFMELSRYDITQREDTYYLLGDAHYNLKRRRDELLYKPVMMKHPEATAYGKKIKLSEWPPHTPLPGCQEKDALTLLTRITHEGTAITVNKEALTYHFATQPKTTLELAWLRIANHAYFSLSIESRARVYVLSLTQQLLGQVQTEDYVTFLKKR